ncbi:OprD family outer membrane porin, partial [Azotobacter vinelandii]
MKNAPKPSLQARPHTLVLPLILAGALPTAQAELLEDAKGTLTLRNFYIHRNFVDDRATRSKAEEWTQSFILDLQSG